MTELARRSSLRPIVSMMLLVACTRGLRPVTSTARIDQELKRVDAALRRLETRPLSPGLQPLAKSDAQAIRSAAAAKSPALRLFRLRSAAINVDTLDFLVAHQKATSSLGAVESLWRSERPRFESKGDVEAASTLQKALIQTARNRAQKLFTASLPYARGASPGDGLYYLAEAEGNLHFAKFVESLVPLEEHPPETLPTPATVAAGRESMLSATLQRFASHPTDGETTPVSALLKESGELIDRNWIAGAALTLLEARLRFDRIAPAQTPPPAAIPSSRGDSIAELLRAMAAEEAAPTAKLIQADLIPSYAALLTGRSPVKVIAAPVTVTLVRWPYT